MNCPKCGFKVWKKDRYCRHCGEEVKYKKRSIKHYRDTRLYLILNILLGNTGIHDIYIGRNIRAGIHIVLFILTHVLHGKYIFSSSKYVTDASFFGAVNLALSIIEIFAAFDLDYYYMKARYNLWDIIVNKIKGKN